MNQDQRKFLLARVQSTYEQQKREIENESRMDKPSLNNYLVAAFLDNTIQFNDIEKLKAKMRKTVIRFGVKDVLVIESDRWGSPKEGSNKVEVIAEDLFVIPQAYLDALKEYDDWRAAKDEKLAKLLSQKDTLTLKIQIGSNAVLDKLVTDVDNLADISLMNAQFLLT